MIKVIRATDRHFSNFGWLKTYWLFSFSRYYDPQNIRFGALRVFNDDVVEPGYGFPTHPHREMEILTIVLEGEITHQDSLGNRSVIQAGDVQRMSAGTGITHSEFNLGDRPTHFYQIWFDPDVPNLQPSYDQRSFDTRMFRNRLAPVASGQERADTVFFHTDATLYLSDLDAGQIIDFQTTDMRRIFVYLTRGEVSINEAWLGRNDQARIDEEGLLRLHALERSKLILIDVPSCKGWGYDGETLQGQRAR